MSCAFASTAEIEQQFSLLQMLSSGRKSHTTLVHLRDAMKVRLDGSSAIATAVVRCAYI